MTGNRAGSGLFHIDQVQTKQHDVGGEKCGHAGDVVGRAHGIDVAGNDIEPCERPQYGDPFARRQPAPGRIAHARRAGWIEHVHIPAEIDRPGAHRRLHLVDDGGDAAIEQIVGGDQTVAEITREIEDMGMTAGSSGDTLLKFRIK